MTPGKGSEVPARKTSASERTKIFRKKIQDSLKIQPKEIVNVTESLGRVLADDVRAKYTWPNKDMAAVDGYAVISSDLKQIPATLNRIGESRSNKAFEGEIQSGQTVKVFAGARVPIGADAVVPLVGVEEFEDYVTVVSQTWHGEHICYAGIDFTEDEKVLKEGTVVTARDIGLAAAMRVSWLPVRRKPRVAVLAIGDELILLGDVTADSSRVNSSSSLVLCSFITACGAVPVNLGIASDSAVSVQQLTEAAEGADLLVTTGGISSSSDNLLRKALIEGSGKKKGHIEEITLNLSKPEQVVLGQKSGISVLALPGNPISAQICAALFLKPAIDKMLDMRESFYKKSYARLGRQLDINDEKMDYIFAKLMEDKDKHLVADPASSQDRLLMSALAEADCLITVDRDNLAHGSQVEITRFTCSVISG